MKSEKQVKSRLTRIRQKKSRDGKTGDELWELLHKEEMLIWVLEDDE